MNPFRHRRVEADMSTERYFAFAEMDRRHGHHVDGSSFEDAAVSFVEHYAPAVDAEGEVRVHVRSEHGVEHCFVVDVADAEVEPCG
jgi:hypothetical protein